MLQRPLSVPIRSDWLSQSAPLWVAGWWLWLLAIFTWMVLLVTIMWTYLPGHRIATMLQSGLTIISALLLIIGCVSWMGLLPLTAGWSDAARFMPLVDGLALSMLGAGLFMGGAVTAWIASDLSRLNHLPWRDTALALAAGALALPSPFLLPTPYLLWGSAACFVAWCVQLGLRSRLPSAFPEWPERR